MADITDYTTTQQKVISEIIKNDNNFHTDVLIADLPFYGMLDEYSNSEVAIKNNVISPLSTGTVDYELQIFYSNKQKCWFYKLSSLGEEIRGVVHYNTVFNAKGEIAFAILNDNVNDTDITSSLPYSNVLILRK